MWDLTWSERAWMFSAGFAATAISEGLAAPFPNPYAVAKKDLPRPTDTIRGRAEFYRHHMSLGKTSVFPGAALNGVEKAMRRAPHAATGFILNDTIREKVNTFHPRQEFGKSLLANITSGAIAGLVTSAVWIPFEIPRFAQTPEGFQQIKQGLYGPAGGCRLAAATTGGALYFGLFSQLQSVNPHGRDGHDRPPRGVHQRRGRVHGWVCGGAAVPRYPAPHGRRRGREIRRCAGRGEVPPGGGEGGGAPPGNVGEPGHAVPHLRAPGHGAHPVPRLQDDAGGLGIVGVKAAPFSATGSSC